LSLEYNLFKAPSLSLTSNSMFSTFSEVVLIFSVIPLFRDVAILPIFVPTALISSNIWVLIVVWAFISAISSHLEVESSAEPCLIFEAISFMISLSRAVSAI